VFGEEEEVVLQFRLHHIVREHSVEEWAAQVDAAAGEEQNVALEVVPDFLDFFAFEKRAIDFENFPALIFVSRQCDIKRPSVVEREAHSDQSAAHRLEIARKSGKADFFGRKKRTKIFFRKRFCFNKLSGKITRFSPFKKAVGIRALDRRGKIGK